MIAVTSLLLFTLKRVALARLQAVQTGTAVIEGTDALLPADVQIAPILPASPDRVAVYFAPVRSQRVQRTAENGVVVETVPLEIRVRVYEPGQDDEDIAGTVEQTLDDVCNAVARALLDGPKLGVGNFNLSNVTQWPTALQSTPEPGATGMASVYITADLMTS